MLKDHRWHVTTYDFRNLETFVRSCSKRSKCVDTKGQNQCNCEFIGFSPFFDVLIWVCPIWASQVRCIFPELAWQKGPSRRWWSQKDLVKTREKSWRVCVTRSYMLATSHKSCACTSGDACGLQDIFNIKLSTNGNHAVEACSHPDSLMVNTFDWT